MKILVCAAAAVLGLAAVPVRAEVIAVVGGTIIDGNGGAPISDGVILIDGKRIAAIGDRSTPIPSRARRIAAQGKFIVPGLMSTGMFLADGTWPPLTILYEGRYDEVAIESAQLALKGGITTVFDTWGPRDALLKAREAIKQGRVPGARIYLCGTWVGTGGPYSDDMRSQFKEAVGEPFAARIDALWEANIGEELVAMPAEEVRQEVRKYAQSGIDFLTYPVNVHRAGAARFIVFSPRVQKVIVEEGHRAGLPVQAMFVSTDEGIRMALDAGADIVAPVPWGGRPMSAETVALLAQRKVPVLDMTAPAADLEWYRKHADPAAVKLQEISDRRARALIRAGAVTLSAPVSGAYSADQLETWRQGSAPGTHAPLGEGHVRSLQGMQDRGMKPVEALMTATRNMARAFKVDKDLGTLEQGKVADLVVLDKNPLESAENYRRIHLVIKEGRIVDRDALPTQRLMTAQPAAAR